MFKEICINEEMLPKYTYIYEEDLSLINALWRYVLLLFYNSDIRDHYMVSVRNKRHLKDTLNKEYENYITVQKPKAK